MYLLFHLYKILVNTKYIICPNKKQSNGCLWMGLQKGKRETRKLWGVMNEMFIIVIVVMVSGMYGYVKIFQIVHFMCSVLYINYTLLKQFRQKQKEKAVFDEAGRR